MLGKLEEIKQRYDTVIRELSDPETFKDQQRIITGTKKS